MSKAFFIFLPIALLTVICGCSTLRTDYTTSVKSSPHPGVWSVCHSHYGGDMVVFGDGKDRLDIWFGWNTGFTMVGPLLIPIIPTKLSRDSSPVKSIALQVSPKALPNSWKVEARDPDRFTLSIDDGRTWIAAQSIYVNSTVRCGENKQCPAPPKAFPGTIEFPVAEDKAPAQISLLRLRIAGRPDEPPQKDEEISFESVSRTHYRPFFLPLPYSHIGEAEFEKPCPRL